MEDSDDLTEPDDQLEDTVRLAALADLHYGRGHRHERASILGRAGAAADVVLLCGDLTDRGTPDEARMLVDDIPPEMRRRCLCVFGNHDHASDRADEVADVLRKAGLRLLDGKHTVVEGVGFAGVSGFGGGFGKRAVQPFGERALREFVGVTVDHALDLETALSQLDADRRVVLLHYAPIRQTVKGEPRELYPFLGASRLADPLDHFDVEAAFHGHAHDGSPRGETSAGTPVYNVSIPVLQEAYPDDPAFVTYDVE
jgi:Icc-related predicted phosphoesterase